MEPKQILVLLKDAKTALKNKDFIHLKQLSNVIIERASLHQDPDLISIAVIIYSLAKLIQREEYKTYNGWLKFYSNYTKYLDDAILELSKDNIKGFRRNIDKIRNIIQQLTGNLKIYIADVFRKASINKASKIYEQGVSMEKTAKILGISLWELSEYVGQSFNSDVNLSVTLPVKQRIKLTEEYFK